MKVVILCGGKGTRMGKLELPKALFPVGGKPILCHIMDIYVHQGFSDFILCLGYKADKIKDYCKKIKHRKITFADTGIDTNTGARIKKIEHLIKDDLFFATYGDGLANIDLHDLLSFHQRHNRTATITITKPYSSFGIVGVNSETGLVTHFEEKPILDHWINGGFFVFNRDVFRYLKEGDILEKDSFKRLLEDKQISAFKHAGFWKCMDTYKDNLELNELLRRGRILWLKK